MGHVNRLIAVLVVVQAIGGSAVAVERGSGRGDQAVPDRLGHSGRSVGKRSSPVALPVAPPVAPIDRVANAVDAAESSHGQDMAMWRPDPAGPQGPMQVSEAAATDVGGGGDRFDMLQNRAMGRAYLAQLFWRYGNWPDAIAAYNWGIGKMDAWVKAGRPPDKLLVGVAAYLRRVLHESGMCNNGAETAQHPQKGDNAGESNSSSPDLLVYAACSGPDAWAGSAGFGGGPSRFSRKLDQALQLALQRAAQAR